MNRKSDEQDNYFLSKKVGRFHEGRLFFVAKYEFAASHAVKASVFQFRRALARIKT